MVSLPSSESTIRGFSGATLIIEDEASRVDDDLYKAIRPMLAVSNGRLLLMSTPFGKRGHFYEAWENGGDVWERIQITAPECRRIPAEFLVEERAALGYLWFNQEYLCMFVDVNTAIFSYDLVMAAVDASIQPLFAEALV